MSVLLARALDAANLDLLLLGGLADRMRRAERGDVVRLHLHAPKDDVVALDHVEDGHVFLRRVAVARLTGGGVIRVDADAVSLQLAQVALTFGADELVIRIDKMSLAVFAENADAFGAAREDQKRILRERELVGLIRAAGRVARVVDRGVERAPDETTPAQRRFRAPGREVAAIRDGEEA